MKNGVWQQICHSEPEEGELWELFHSNSRSTLVDLPMSSDVVRERMLQLAPSLHYADRPAVRLPEPATLEMTLAEAIENRVSARQLRPSPLALETLAAVLHAAYGETRDNADGMFPRPFRTVPSAGALYPLEMYFHTVHTEGLDAGLYHFDPSRRAVRRLRDGDGSRFISEGLVQKSLPFDSSVFLFISALPERCTFKYGNRGYRFLLMEAGHVAQNVSLAAASLGLGCLCVGGFLDRHIDEYLGFDGLHQSTVYLMAIGRVADDDQAGPGVQAI